MKPSRLLLVWSMCSLVLLGDALAAPPGRKPPGKPRSAQKSSTETARQSARRASVSQRSTYSARVSSASTTFRQSGPRSQQVGGRAAVAAHAPGVSLSGVKSPKAVDSYDLSVVRSTLAGTRRMSLPGELNVLRAANLSEPRGGASVQASERVASGKTPLRRPILGAGVRSQFQAAQQCFTRTIQVHQTEEETTAIRYLHSTSERPGHWYAPSRTPLSPRAAYDGLALPQMPTSYETVRIPKGTLVLEGPCAASPSRNQKGGHPQLYVVDPGQVAVTVPQRPLPQ